MSRGGSRPGAGRPKTVGRHKQGATALLQVRMAPEHILLLRQVAFRQRITVSELVRICTNASNITRPFD